MPEPYNFQINTTLILKGNYMAFTYFFRDLQTLELIVEHLLPFISGRSRISVWDAGCASGQEPYTLAILCAEKMHNLAFKNLNIYATDIDISNQFGKIIKDGIYPYSELERIPVELFKKYFNKYDADNNFQIDANLRNKMIFKREDLLDFNAPADEMSLVLCKNVLLHLTAEQRIEVIKIYHKALAKGGLFAMENTQKLPEE